MSLKLLVTKTLGSLKKNLMHFYLKPVIAQYHCNFP